VRLVFLRHGPAEVREIFAASGQPDEKRPLTDEGERRTRQAARGLRALIGEFDVLATSPLTRAAQTAAIVAEVFGGPAPVEVEALEPGTAPGELARWLEKLAPEATVVLVGHEPGLSETVTWLVSGLYEPILSLGKAGCAVVEAPAEIDAGRAVLRSLLRPGQLRRLRS
jgi:phosphohistidine phosphatase